MKFSALPLAALLALTAASSVRADDWPNRPVKAITTTSAGGLSDIFMRALGEELRKKWGQSLIIENRPGGAMNLGTRACADAQPDGYTICITNADAMLYNQFLYKKLPFDPETSVTPITNAFHLIHMLGGECEPGREECRRALARCPKATAGTLSYLAPGAPMVLYMETHEEGEGCDWVRVPFRGGWRSRQCHPGWVDADRPVRRGQCHRQHPGRPNDAAGDDEQHPLAEFPGCAAAHRGRLQTARRREAGTAFSVPPACEAHHRPGVEGHRRGRQQTEFRDRHLTARSLVPAANTPEQFAEDMKRERCGGPRRS